MGVHEKCCTFQPAVALSSSLHAALFYSAYLVGVPRWMPAGNALGSSAWTLIGAALVFSFPAVLALGLGPRYPGFDVAGLSAWLPGQQVDVHDPAMPGA
jgi:hypothetical protein